MKFRTGSSKWYAERELHPPFSEVEVDDVNLVSGTWTPLDKEAEAALVALKAIRAEKASTAGRLKQVEAELAALKKLKADAPHIVEHGGPAGNKPGTTAVVEEKKEPAKEAKSDAKRASDKHAL